MAKLFEAEFEFQTEDNTVRSITILFEAEGAKAAIADAARWWGNRNRAIPDHFHRVLALKVWGTVPQRVREDGYLDKVGGWPFYEWKMDFPFRIGEGIRSHVT